MTGCRRPAKGIAKLRKGGRFTLMRGLPDNGFPDCLTTLGFDAQTPCRIPSSDRPSVDSPAGAIQWRPPVALPPMSDNRPDSPCIALCSTALGDEVCAGCGRTFLEVANWVAMNPVEKEAVWARLEAHWVGLGKLPPWQRKG